MKKTIFLLLALLLAVSAQAQKMHAFIFANTFNRSIGTSVTHDFENIKIEFKTISQYIGYELVTHYYSGSSFSLRNLQLELQNFQCSPQDVVVFYYSGHGIRAFNDQSKFPRMVMVSNEPVTTTDCFPLSDVRNSLIRRNPRLTVILGDLCNSIDSGFVASPGRISKGATILSKEPRSVYSDLFLKMKGTVVACSSQLGETSAAYPSGGLFTLAFKQALQTMVSGNNQASWNSLLSLSKSLTANTSRQKQNPYYEINLVEATANEPSTSQNTAPANAPFTTTASNDQIETALISIGCEKNENSRISAIPSTLRTFFASENAKIEVVGRDGETVVGTYRAADYLEQLSIAYKLVNVVRVNEKLDSKGKIVYLKLHEMYNP